MVARIHCPYTPEQLRELRKTRTLADLAAEQGVSYGTIHKWTIAAQRSLGEKWDFRLALGKGFRAFNAALKSAGCKGCGADLAPAFLAGKNYGYYCSRACQVRALDLRRQGRSPALTLTAREVLALLDCGMPMKRVAKSLGLSRQRVSQIVQTL